MELAIIVGLICFLSSLFGMWAGARYNPLCVQPVEPKKIIPYIQFAGRARRSYGHEANLHMYDDEPVPTLKPVQFFRDPKTGRFVKTE